MNLFGMPPPRDRLARSLARLRVAAGLSQPQLARRLGWSQAKVSRIENGKQVVGVPDVEAWARVTQAPAARRDELMTLAEDAKLGTVSADTVLGHGLAFAQQATRELEASARTLRLYQPVIIPGLLQTPGYIRQIFDAGLSRGHPDIDQAIATRLARQEILYDEARRFEFVISEAALRWRFGTRNVWPEVIGRQLNLLRHVITMPNVSIGVIPLEAEAPVWHTHGFVIFDDRADDDPLVTVETLTAAIVVSDQGQVDEYRQAFARLKGVAVFDDAARSLLERIAADVRR